MKSAILKEWGHINYEDVSKPEIKDGHCLVKVHYAGVCGSDVHIYKGTNPIATTPLIPGHEFAGEIAQLPSNAATKLKVGQKVAVRPLISCGQCPPCQEGIDHLCQTLTVIGVNANGGFAEYVSVPLNTLIPVEDNLPTQIAALCEPFAVGLHTCRQGQVKKNDTVLIIGGGPIGIAAGLMARTLGAKTVAISEPKQERRAIGQRHGFETINPLDDGFVKAVHALLGTRGFDVAIETSGSHQGMETAVDHVKAKGHIVCLGFPEGGEMPYSVTKAILKEITLVGSRVYTQQDYVDTTQLLSQAYFSNSIDFSAYISSIRTLEALEDCIHLVADGIEDGKVLLKMN